MAQHFEIGSNRLLLVVATDRRVAQYGGEVVTFRISPRFREVAFPVVEVMVILIVGRNPRESRVTVEQR
jgi:hypothetical protein